MAPRRQVHHVLLKAGPQALGTSSSQAPRGGEKTIRGSSLVVKGLRLHTPNVKDLGSIPAQGTRSHMLQLTSGTVK